MNTILNVFRLSLTLILFFSPILNFQLVCANTQYLGVKNIKINNFQHDTEVFHPAEFNGRIEKGMSSDRNRGYVFRLLYDVSSPGEYAGCYRLLNNLDLNKHGSLCFWIKGKSGKEECFVGLKNTEGQESRVRMGTFLNNGIARKWQKVSIPLQAFTGLKNFSNMESISFVFENGLGDDKGIIYLDDLYFKKNLSSMAVINCSDGSGKSVWGDNSWLFDASNSNIIVNFDPDGCLIQYKGVEVSRENVSYSGWGINLEGIDASPFEMIAFRIKRIHGTERPNLYLDDGKNKAYIDVEKYCAYTDEWEKIQIPVREFAIRGVDISNLKKLSFVFTCEKMPGAIYLDDIRFEQLYIDTKKIGKK
ncbi:MAG: hypothetical protein P9M03_10130 [Candidatus Theseobacter exili]|nr:hypothetical protein [Candidatus Theseobacter exili]